MEYANEFPVKKMCQLLDVSRSGYYNWLKNKEKTRNNGNSTTDKIARNKNQIS